MKNRDNMRRLAIFSMLGSALVLLLQAQAADIKENLHNYLSETTAYKVASDFGLLPFDINHGTLELSLSYSCGSATAAVSFDIVVPKNGMCLDATARTYFDSSGNPLENFVVTRRLGCEELGLEAESPEKTRYGREIMAHREFRDEDRIFKVDHMVFEGDSVYIPALEQRFDVPEGSCDIFTWFLRNRQLIQDPRVKKIPTNIIYLINTDGIWELHCYTKDAEVKRKDGNCELVFDLRSMPKESVPRENGIDELKARFRMADDGQLFPDAVRLCRGFLRFNPTANQVYAENE
ncbi:MAG: hypothetical protein V1659_00905 [Candidatus Woesearchaeota archaeon]